MSKIYTTTLNKGERIELPNELITFYKSRGVFVSCLPSYEQIQGKGANEPAPAIYDKNGDPIVWTASIENTERKDRIESLKKAELAGRLFFGRKYFSLARVVSRQYMLNGSTKPIRLEFLLSGSKEKTLYVKKPDLLRVLGKDLYNRLSGNKPLEFKFNEYVFIVKEAEGNLLNQKNKSYFVNSETFADNLVRLGVLDDFISINDLGSRGGQRNLIVNNKGNISVIDFDSLFANTYFATAMDNFRFNFGVKFLEQRIEEVARDEKLRIKKRFAQNSNYLEKLIKMMSKIRPLNKIVKESYGDKTVRHYFERKLRMLG